MEWTTILTSGLTALLTTLLAYFIQERKLRVEWEARIEAHKTEYMAEQTARYFLLNKGYTDRSFDMLKSALGGFEDDELRKILVRAGAIRSIRKDGSEWWTLVERIPEKVARKRRSQERGNE